MNRELNIFGDRSVGRATLGRATGYSVKCTPLTPPKVRFEALNPVRDSDHQEGSLNLCPLR